MYYIWWIFSIFLYIFILVSYAGITRYIAESDDSTRIPDSIFFAVTSIITLSIIPLVKVNLYGSE